MFLNQNITVWPFSDRSLSLGFTFSMSLSVSDIMNVSMQKKEGECDLDQSHISLQTKLTAFFFLEAIVRRHIQRDSFYSHFYFCLIIFLLQKLLGHLHGSFPFYPFWYAATSMQQQWKEKTNRNIYFLFLTWGDRGIHLNNRSHWNDSSKVNMNI